MMTTFIEVRTLWTFHGDTMVPLQKIEWIFTLWKLLAEVAGIALLLGGALAHAPRYDLLLKGGHVIDPANHLDAVMDVAVLKDKIAAVEKDIPASQAGKVVNASGLYVTPGLIDIHFHIGHGGAPLNWFAPEARAHIGPLGIPADLALQSGVTNLPVMFDFWPRPERTYADLILNKMRPGDIHTHVFAQQFPIILPDGKLNPIMAEARARGVIFDVGHGAGSFWFRNAVPAVKQGFVPDSMSTDLHSGNYTVLSMSNVLSKFLNMGVSLSDLIRRATANPAHEIHRPELGTLSVGREADIAVLEELRGHFGYIDCGYAKMDGTLRIVAQMTIRGGRIL